MALPATDSITTQPLLSESFKDKGEAGVRRTRRVEIHVAERYASCSMFLKLKAEGRV